MYVCTPVFLEARSQIWVSFLRTLSTLFLEAGPLIPWGLSSRLRLTERAPGSLLSLFPNSEIINVHNLAFYVGSGN